MPYHFFLRYIRKELGRDKRTDFGGYKIFMLSTKLKGSILQNSTGKNMVPSSMRPLSKFPNEDCHHNKFSEELDVTDNGDKGVGEGWNGGKGG